MVDTASTLLPRCWALLVLVPSSGDPADGHPPFSRPGRCCSEPWPSKYLQSISLSIPSRTNQHQNNTASRDCLPSQGGKSIERTSTAKNNRDVYKRPVEASELCSFTSIKEESDDSTKLRQSTIVKSKFVMNTPNLQKSSSDIAYLHEEDDESQPETTTELVEILLLVRARSGGSRIPITVNDVSQFRLQLRQKLVDMYNGGRNYTPMIVRYGPWAANASETAMTAAMDTVCSHSWLQPWVT